VVALHRFIDLKGNLASFLLPRPHLAEGLDASFPNNSLIPLDIMCVQPFAPENLGLLARIPLYLSRIWYRCSPPRCFRFRMPFCCCPFSIYCLQFLRPPVDSLTTLTHRLIHPEKSGHDLRNGGGFLLHCVFIIILQYCKNMQIINTFSLKKLTMSTRPKAYQMEWKLKEAGILLKSGKYKVQEVDEMVGFEDAPNFQHIFKKTFGKAPGEWAEK